MQARKLVIAVIAAAVVFGLWYAFRPERLFTNVTVNEQFPETQVASASTQLRMGQFHDGAHQTLGMATIHQLADGKRVLRLSNFETSNGPDVHVYLAVAPDALDNETVIKDGFVDLGTIKGNKGDQNYELAADLDVAKYNSVVIWCKRFSVNFGAAPLVAGGNLPAASQKLVAAGEFHKVAHDAQGYAMVHQLADGRRILRFTEFETSNGPELRVYAVAAADASDSDSVKKAGFVDLGALKGNKGDQNYELPKELDLAKYQSVAVWCKRFSVNFATAPLTPKS